MPSAAEADTAQDAEAYPPQLLDDYLAIARRRGDALVATALRTRSVAVRTLLAHAATDGQAALADLLAAARAGRAPRVAEDRLDSAALTDLARVVALQNVQPSDQADGLALLDLALARFGSAQIPPYSQGLHAQLAFYTGDHHRAEALLALYPRVRERIRAELAVDLANPVHGRLTYAPNQWQELFAQMLPEPGISLTGQPGLPPFDQLTAPPAPAVPDDDLVSVIVTTYCPDQSLFTSLRSLLAQTWANLEILLIDDGSPSSYQPLLHRAGELDPRIRLVPLAANGGTYLARNAGLDEARGRFIAFQDSDDWAHPSRIATQVQALVDDPSLVATFTNGLRLSEQLIITIPGRQAMNLNWSSMTFRREPVLRRLGYFDRVRKGADTEYMRRLEAVFGCAAVRLVGDQPYALVRRTTSSLTASDFAAGWMHPGREAYRRGYEVWHEQVTAGTSAPWLAREQHRRPFAAPVTHTLAPPTSLPGYDVVLAGDWCAFGGPQKSMLAEIEALTSNGMRVGVLHLEPLRFMSSERRRLCHAVQSLINDGEVGQLLLSEPARTELLLIRYPPVLQFGPSTPSRLRATRVVIVANQAPSERDGSDQRYVPLACTQTARWLFSADPVWCPQGPEVRDQLEQLGGATLASIDLPGIIDAERWRTVRSRFRGDRPVIGRHARNDWTKWPADAETLRQVYPDSPDVDVRFMGGATPARKLLGSLPPNWVVFDRDELDVRSFLNQLDFYVYFPHPQMFEAFGRSTLEAMAAGCLAILPHRFRRTFGDAAVYCEPKDVREVVRSYYAKPRAYRHQLRQAARLIRQQFSHDAHVARITALRDS